MLPGYQDIIWALFEMKEARNVNNKGIELSNGRGSMKELDSNDHK